MNFKREIVFQVSLLFALGIFVGCLNDILCDHLHPKNQDVQCNDPGISKPLVMDYEWIANSVRLTRMYIMPILLGYVEGIESKRDVGLFYHFLLTMIPSIIFLNGFAATKAVVTTISSFWGSLAPNFLSVCQPDNLIHRLCQLKSINYLSKICPKCATFQMSARSAFPSMIPTLQAFNMCFLALYIGYRMNTQSKKIWGSVKRYFKYLIQLGAFVFILVTGFATIHRNEADHPGVWSGCAIGILSAVVAMAVLRRLEGRIRRKLPPMNDPPGIPTTQDDAAHQNKPSTNSTGKKKTKSN